MDTTRSELKLCPVEAGYVIYIFGWFAAGGSLGTIKPNLSSV